MHWCCFDVFLNTIGLFLTIFPIIAIRLVLCCGLRRGVTNLALGQPILARSMTCAHTRRERVACSSHRLLLASSSSPPPPRCRVVAGRPSRSVAVSLQPSSQASSPSLGGAGVVSGGSDAASWTTGPLESVGPASHYSPVYFQVCREFQRDACSRSPAECRFAHPPDGVAIDAAANSVTVCMDYVKGKCARDLCRYYHPAPHLQAQIKAATAAATQTRANCAAAAPPQSLVGRLPPPPHRPRPAAARPPPSSRSLLAAALS